MSLAEEIERHQDVDVLSGQQGAEPIKNKDIPVHGLQQNAPIPTATQEFNAEMQQLGELWSQILRRREQESLIEATTTSFGYSGSDSYEMTKITMGPNQMEIATLGDVGQTITRFEEIIRGSFNRYMLGIKIPTKIGGGIEYQQLWDAQVNANIDAMHLQAQLQVIEQILRNPNPLLRHFRVHGFQRKAKTVEDFFEAYDWRFVNIFRRKNALVHLYVNCETYMDILFKERRQVANRSQIYGFLIPKRINIEENLKPENTLVIYEGPPSARDAPIKTIYDWSRWVKSKDAFIIVNSLFQIDDPEGLEFLISNRMRPRFASFKPFDYKGDGREQASPNYDIGICNDETPQLEEKVNYLSAVEHILWSANGNGTPMSDDINLPQYKKNSEYFLKWFTGPAFPKDKKIETFYDFLKLVIVDGDTIEQKNKELKNNELEFCIRKLDKNGSVDSYIQFIINSLGRKGKSDETIKSDIKTFSKVIIKIVGTASFEGIDDVEASIYMMIYYITDFLGLDTIEIWRTLVTLFKGETEANNLKIIFDQKKLIKMIQIFKTIKRDNILAILIGMHNLKMEMPFGVWCFTRPIMREYTTPYFRHGCIDTCEMRLIVTLTIDIGTGDLHGTLFKGFGERLMEKRDIVNFNGTFIIKCIGMGNLNFMKYPSHDRQTDDGYEKKLSDYKKNSNGLIVFPVTKNEAMFPPKHINLTGYDSEEIWGKILKLIRVKSPNVPNFYFSTHERLKNLFRLHEVLMSSKTISDYYLNNDELIIPEVNCSKRRTVYYANDTVENETGPFAQMPEWWMVESPAIRVEQVKKGENTVNSQFRGVGF